MDMARIDWNGVALAEDFTAPLDEEALGPSLILARQRYFDAMHMPAATIGLAHGQLQVAACNGGFRGLADALLFGKGDDAAAILTDFLEGQADRRRFRSGRYQGVVEI